MPFQVKDYVKKFKGASANAIAAGGGLESVLEENRAKKRQAKAFDKTETKKQRKLKF